MSALKILLLSLLATEIAAKIDYCKMACGEEHIACYTEDAFTSECGEEAKLVNITKHIDLILELHNIKRDRVAAGRDYPLGSASRIGEMSWDDELAYIAQLYVRQCRLWRSSCQSTSLFSHPGRNANIFRHWKGYTDAELILARIEQWLDQSYSMTMDMALNYPKDRQIPRISYFATAVMENNNRVGCAAVRFVDDDRRKFFLLTCLYPSSLKLGMKLYTEGLPTVDCQSGVSGAYPHLCSREEEYDYMEASQFTNSIESPLLDLEVGFLAKPSI